MLSPFVRAPPSTTAAPHLLLASLAASNSGCQSTTEPSALASATAAPAPNPQIACPPRPTRAVCPPWLIWPRRPSGAAVWCSAWRSTYVRQPTTLPSTTAGSSPQPCPGTLPHERAPAPIVNQPSIGQVVGPAVLTVIDPTCASSTSAVNSGEPFTTSHVSPGTPITTTFATGAAGTAPASAGVLAAATPPTAATTAATRNNLRRTATGTRMRAIDTQYAYRVCTQQLSLTLNESQRSRPLTVRVQLRFRTTPQREINRIIWEA